ncbi:glycosyltransferase [Peribacillus frigoritolerans]
MKILHVSLGLPPFRSGGLTKYSVDLMLRQKKKNDVYLIYPGSFKVGGRTKVCENKSYFGINVFEIINPLPVSLLGGINKPELFVKDTSQKLYEDFLSELSPKIIHIHTLMGIHKEFFMAAKKLNIKMLFTTHDYFGICPKVNLIDNTGDICLNNDNGIKCISCNIGAYSFPLLYLLQSKLYRKYKGNDFVKKIRKSRKGKSKCADKVQNKVEDLSLSSKYNKLRDYYFDIFNLIDFFHFNSEITEEVFKKYLKIEGKIIPISHNDIYDNRKVKTYDVDSPLKISFLGPLDKYKGFPLLLSSVKTLLNNENTNWILNVYGNNSEIELEKSHRNKIIFHGPYLHNELESIFNNTDVLVVPSVWKETFGFIGLEALSFGVPVMVSESVGFKDLISNGETGIIFKPESAELAFHLEKIIKNRSILKEFNHNICNTEFSFTLDKHEREINDFYNDILGVLV